jgi:hypothetical protein
MRHDRDDSVPRTREEVVHQIQTVTQRIADTFREQTLILPTIGNWDTRVPSSSNRLDYEDLYNLWKVFWSPKERATIFDTFLEGGYYMVHTKFASVISMNTLDWFEESQLDGMCS